MAEEKNIENNSGLGATGNFIHSYIQEDLKGIKSTPDLRPNQMATCISVMQNPSA